VNATTDWYEAAEITAGCYQLTEARAALPCNAFLIEDGGEALVIDTGLGVGDLRAMAAGLVDATPRVLLTHSHWDHIGAAHQFDDVLAPARERTADGTVSIDVLSEEFLDRPEQFVANWRELERSFPEGFDPDAYDIEPVHGVDAVAPGDRLAVGDRELELLHVPGHSPGQLAALDEEAGILYGADVVGIGGSLYAHFQDSDVRTYIDTFAELVDLREAGAFDVLATGHNDPYRGDDLDVLEEMRVALGDILDDTAEYEVVETDWGPARQYDFGAFTVLTDTTIE
jgi:glyoxylase-like metal-dependent hydrolase (beta-lactamase superfamily II)